MDTLQFFVRPIITLNASVGVDVGEQTLDGFVIAGHFVDTIFATHITISFSSPTHFSKSAIQHVSGGCVRCGG